MAYITISASQTDADSPLDQTLMDALRTNEDDLDTRLRAIGISASESIYSEFGSSVIDTDCWDVTNGIAGAGTVGNPTLPGHYIIIDAGGAAAGNCAGILGATKRMHVRMSDTQAIIFKARIKITTNTAAFLMGMQDASKTGTGINDFTNAFAFDVGSAGATLRLICNKGGAGATSSDVGTTSNWTAVELRMTQTGSVLTADGYIDGAQITSGGFPVTTNVPDTTTLRPVIWIGGDGANRGVVRVDRCHAYWSASPDSA